MPIALDRRLAYYGLQLSENIARTPDGYLICKNAVIARTGFQSYRVSELADPERLLPEVTGPDDSVDVWRDPSEVFSPATIASFEGKTFTVTHPNTLLGPDNDNQHSHGHVQNVRPGREPLDSGDMPLLADIIVKSEEAIRAIETGSRELSCGYTYRLAREGRRWDQRDIVGNHVALVQRARAGSEARINDSAPAAERAPGRERRMKITNYLKHIVGEGLKVFAKDADPEDVTDVLRDAQVAAALEAGIDGKKKEPTVISVATDAAAPAKTEEKFELVGKTSDGIEVFKKVVTPARVVATDSEEQKKERKELLEKVDSILETIKGKNHAAADADIENLKKKVNDLMEGETEDGEEHPKGCRCDDCMDKAKDTETEKEQIEEDEDKEDKEDKEGEDAEIVRSEPVLSASERPESAIDAATLQRIVADSNLAMLGLFKPFIAKSGDKKLKAAYDTMTTSLKKVIKGNSASNASYALFLKAATTLGKEARDSVDKNERGSKEFKPRKSQAELDVEAADKIYAEAAAERSKNSPLALMRN